MTHRKAKKQILFVDDEPNILKGLKRMLRSMRKEWDMAFAESGAQALEMLSQRAFDVIVSDMRMPHMDGLALLTTVKQRYPMIVRIILSGHSDQEMILKSVKSVHQYLSKPCDYQELISTVTRSCALNDFLNHENLRQIISKTDTIPSLPSLYMDIMDELQSPAASVERLGKIIEKDLGMTAKIFQLVNSSFFGSSRHISNLSQAVIMLGLDTICSLVLTIGIFSKLDALTMTTLHLEKIYEHSIKTGTIAQKIAIHENADRETVANAFITGLLHDLGKIIFAVNLPETYKTVFKLSQDGDMPFMDAEFQLMGATHAQVGAYLLGLWGLPDVIVEGVAFHHSPDNCQDKTFSPLVAVHVANIFENNTRVSSNEMARVFDAAPMMQSRFHEKIPIWKPIADEVSSNRK